MEEPEKSESFGEADYLLETPLLCPRCGEAIQSLCVVRLLRDRVNFVSSLPRRGYALACPACRALLAGELTGLP